MHVKDLARGEIIQHYKNQTEGAQCYNKYKRNQEEISKSGRTTNVDIVWHYSKLDVLQDAEDDLIGELLS